MNLKLFYSPPKWFAFEAPEKPDPGYETFICENAHYKKQRERKYNKAYAEAKANALEVGNEESIMQKFYGSTSTLSDGVEFDWPGSAVIKDGRYILSIMITKNVTTLGRKQKKATKKAVALLLEVD